MRQAIGIGLPQEVLRQIEKLSREEMETRTTVIRKLVLIGYKDFMQRKSAEEYLKGSMTLSEAAHQAGLTIWEMEKYLVEQGFKSSYSIEDLEREMKTLK